MSEKNNGSHRSRFSKFAWFALGYNVVVILWGVFLRATHSGDGCGQHWITCGGEPIPTAPAFATVIEFSHRVTTMLAGFVVIALLIWAFRAFAKGHIVRKMALASFLFIAIEGLIGGGLVLTGNVAGNWTPERPYWTAGHLINTFILVAFLALTAWYSEKGRAFTLRIETKVIALIAAGIFAIFITGISGSMAALTNMLFPSATIAEGIAKDLAPDSHILLRLRILHPILSIFTAIFLVFISGWIKRMSGEDKLTAWWSNALAMLVMLQVIFGAATLLMLAPIIMQLGHLLLADLVWIAFILMSASYISSAKNEASII